MTSSTMTSPSALRSLHHCSPKSEKMMRAVDELITLMTKVCRPISRRRLLVTERGDPLWNSFDSQISNVRENPRHSSENEQIRILLERQREQILVDCQAEIRKHEFQADCDRRSIQKLKLSSIKDFIVLIKETNNFDEINNFFMNNYRNKIGSFVKFMRKVSVRWKN